MLSHDTTPSRPSDRLAAAIYDQVAIKENGDTRETVLAYRDRLRELQHLRTQLVATLRHCVGTEPDDQSANGKETGRVDSLFTQAQQLLSVDNLARVAPPDLLAHCNNQLQRLGREIAAEFLCACEGELDRGRIGHFRQFNGTLARCRCPAKTLSGQFPSPESAMLDDLFEDTESVDTPSESATTSVEFFMGLDSPLADARRVRQAFRPAQLLHEKAPPPLRPLLRVVSGSPYRDSDQLGEGGFTAIVLFHYVLDWWTQEKENSMNNASARPTSRAYYLPMLLGSAIVCLILGLAIGSRYPWEQPARNQIAATTLAPQQIEQVNSPASATNSPLRDDVRISPVMATRSQGVDQQPLARILLVDDFSTLCGYRITPALALSGQQVCSLIELVVAVSGEEHTFAGQASLPSCDEVALERSKAPAQQITQIVRYPNRVVVTFAQPPTTDEADKAQRVALEFCRLTPWQRPKGSLEWSSHSHDQRTWVLRFNP